MRSQNQVIFKHLSGRRVSVHVCRPLCRCLKPGSSMHVFELDSTWIFPIQISLLEVCLSWVISSALVGHLSASGKGGRFWEVWIYIHVEQTL
jgi:hypothetical protein